MEPSSSNHYPFETFKDDNKNREFSELLRNLRVETEYAMNYFEEYKGFIERLKSLLDLIREDILGNKPDYNTVSFDDISFNPEVNKLPNIQRILGYVVRLRNTLILTQNDEKRPVFIPVDLHYLVNSYEGSVKAINNMNELISDYDNGTINQQKLRRYLEWRIQRFMFEKRFLFNTLNSEFLNK